MASYLTCPSEFSIQAIYFFYSSDLIWLVILIVSELAPVKNKQKKKSALQPHYIVKGCCIYFLL